MRHIIPHVLAGIVVVLPVGAEAASTIECKAELPAARTGYWSWRIIDGKRCWYPGRAKLAKSQLEWRRPAPAPDRVLSTPARSSPKQKAIEAIPSASNIEELTFENRWPR